MRSTISNQSTMQHWRILVAQGRMFDGSTTQGIITRHLDLLYEKFMRYFPNEIRETEHIAWVKKSFQAPKWIAQNSLSSKDDSELIEPGFFRSIIRIKV